MRVYKSPSSEAGVLYGYEGNEKTRMDTRACSHIEVACPKENTRGADRQDLKAHSGRNASKSI